LSLNFYTIAYKGVQGTRGVRNGIDVGQVWLALIESSLGIVAVSSDLVFMDND
jgi:nicotinamide mononucleotide (NMN) deamidase PncC